MSIALAALFYVVGFCVAWRITVHEKPNESDRNFVLLCVVVWPVALVVIVGGLVMVLPTLPFIWLRRSFDKRLGQKR